jgi:hypothetical protein
MPLAPETFPVTVPAAADKQNAITTLTTVNDARFIV